MKSASFANATHGLHYSLSGFFEVMKGVTIMCRLKLSKQVMWLILITLLLVGCGAPAAISTPTSVRIEVVPTSPQEIAGVWDSKVWSERGYHQFREDGTLVIAYTYELVETNPIFNVPSQYWFEGETFHVKDDCGHGTYLLTLTREDDRNQKLSFQLIEDPCEQRIMDYKTPMRWMEP